MSSEVRSEDVIDFEVVAPTKKERDDYIIEEALSILDERFRRGEHIASPKEMGEYLKLKLANYPYEVFACLYLDSRHRVLSYQELFRGTVDGASVHVREIVREVLVRNAACVVFAHNHPSGVPEPSFADRAITRDASDALKLIDVRVLDHLVIGTGEPVSMSARGLI